MYTLYKCSAPGWEREFDSIFDLKEELELNVCNACFGESVNLIDPDTGQILMEIDPDPFHINRKEYNRMDVYNQISELLGSACGAEFNVCDNTVEAIRSE